MLNMFLFQIFDHLKKTVNIPISNFSVFIGANNAGKSSILHALYFIQNTIENNIRINLRAPLKTRSRRAGDRGRNMTAIYNPETDLPLDYNK